jgi:hypothetical protein
MRRLLADTKQANGRKPIDVQPAWLDLERVAVVQRVACGTDEVRLFTQEKTFRDIDLADELELVLDLKARGDAKPMIDARILAERVCRAVLA